MIKFRAVAAMVMLTFSSGAFAVNWVHVDNTVEFKAYIDGETVRIRGSFREFWTLFNYNKPRKRSSRTYLSTIGLVSIDCEERMAHLKQVVDYQRHNGQGSLVSRVTEQQAGHQSEGTAIPIIPGSIFDAYREVTCALK